MSKGENNKMEFNIKDSKMIGADTNCEMLTLKEIEKKYHVRFDADFSYLFDENECYTVNPILIQLLRHSQC